MDKREFMRFPVELRIEARKEKEEYTGLIKDFSRKGLSAVFDEFKFDLHSPLELKIQEPGSDTWIPAYAEAIWKRQAKDKWYVGLVLKSLPSENRAQILEHGYVKWLKENIFPS